MKIAPLFLLVLLLNNCSEASKKLVVENTYDFGRVIQADTLKTIFQLRNDLDKDLKIEEFFASSNQVKVLIDKKILKPKENATINVQFFTDNLNGSQKRMISIKTDNETDPYYKYYILADVQSLDAHKRETLFNLINNKKETAHNLPKDFDFSKNYTEKELEALNLDPSKIDANEYYFMSGQKFLKEEVDGLSFLIYYKNFYGNQLEKILRVHRKDTVFDIVLAGRYSNGSDGSTLSTEFTNDFTFKTSLANITTIKDEPSATAIIIDSLFVFYDYNKDLDFVKNRDYSWKFYEEIKENPETGEKDTLFQNMNLIGKVQNTEFLSGITYTKFNSSLPQTIRLYSKNKNNLSQLTRIENTGAYINSKEIFTVDGNYFISIKMGETSGITYSHFFGVNTKTMTLSEVEQDYGNFKLPDSLQYHKGYGITRQADNRFISGSRLRSEENDNEYYLEREHKMTKENGKFVLKCISTEITPTDN